MTQYRAPGLKKKQALADKRLVAAGIAGARRAQAARSTAGGGLITLARAGIVGNVANTAIAGLVDVGGILRVLPRTDTAIDLNYGTFTPLATPIA